MGLHWVAMGCGTVVVAVAHRSSPAGRRDLADYVGGIDLADGAGCMSPADCIDPPVYVNRMFDVGLVADGHRVAAVHNQL
jgi:hypothetical protein